MKIKYRVWDKITEKMYYPSTGVANDLYMSLEGSICSEDEEIQEDGSRLAYRGYRMTPLLYTGLKDKNGKEIYKGDIIEVKHPFKDRYYKGEIIFEWGAFKAKDFYFAHFDNTTDFTEGIEYVEIIGNIYENSELLN